MKRFVSYILTLMIIVVLLAIILDVSYTYVFRHGASRNKVTQLLKLENTSFDAVFLGSSRVENHIKTSLFKKQHINALNLGVQGGSFQDNLLFLRLLLRNNNEVKKLFIQVDYSYNIEKETNLIQSYFLPYVRDDYFYTYYKDKNDESIMNNYYIPFYRYAKNDFKIGFRELFNAFIGKENPYLEEGFIPLKDKLNLKDIKLPKQIKEINTAIIKIEELAKEKGIEIIYFCAPFCSKLENEFFLKKLETKVSPFYNYAFTIEDEFFRDCRHLNEMGAEIFTKRLINEHFITPK